MPLAALGCSPQHRQPPLHLPRKAASKQEMGGVGRGDEGRSQRAGPQQPWGGWERVEPQFGKKDSELCPSPNPLLLAPLGPSAHLRWRLYSPGCLFCYWEDAGLNPVPGCVPARKSPQVTWWSSTRGGPAPPREHLEMHQGHFDGQKDQSTPLPFTGGTRSGRDGASQNTEFHASPAQLSSTHSLPLRDQISSFM